MNAWAYRSVVFGAVAVLVYSVMPYYRPGEAAAVAAGALATLLCVRLRVIP